MAQRVFAEVKMFDDATRVADFEEEELVKEQHRSLTQFENQMTRMKSDQRQKHDAELIKFKKDMIGVIAARE